MCLYARLLYFKCSICLQHLRDKKKSDCHRALDSVFVAGVLLLLLFLANKAARSHVQIFPDDILNYQTAIIQALNPGSEMKEPGWTHLDAVTVR